LVTEMLPTKSVPHLSKAPGNTALPQKPSAESLPPPVSTTRPANNTPELETGTQKESTPPLPAESVQTLPPFKEKVFTVQFPSDSNEFSPGAYALLDDIIDIARKYHDLEISIAGYTDSVGDRAYNKQLSRFRATVVKSYLVGHGVDSNQILVSGMGPDNPIATNDTREGRQLNRRVEIKLHSKK